MQIFSFKNKFSFKKMALAKIFSSVLVLAKWANTEGTETKNMKNRSPFGEKPKPGRDVILHVRP